MINKSRFKLLGDNINTVEEYFLELQRQRPKCFKPIGFKRRRIKKVLPPQLPSENVKKVTSLLSELRDIDHRKVMRAYATQDYSITDTIQIINLETIK